MPENEPAGYDPVTALDEQTATGETAEIFADIRRTMDIPLVTSIWRGLAGIENSLPTVWAKAKPIYLTGLPELSLAWCISEAQLPLPSIPSIESSAHPDMDQSQSVSELAAIKSIVDAYNRSNGLNLIALSALVATPANVERRSSNQPAEFLLEWPELPRLMGREEIDGAVWHLIEQVNALGAHGVEPNVATLWRHLARWPRLLEQLHRALLPLQAQGLISTVAGKMVVLAREEGTKLAHHRDESVQLPVLATATISGYVSDPAKVARMVVVGHVVAQFLRRFNN